MWHRHTHTDRQTHRHTQTNCSKNTTPPRFRRGVKKPMSKTSFFLVLSQILVKTLSWMHIIMWLFPDTTQEDAFLPLKVIVRMREKVDADKGLFKD